MPIKLVVILLARALAARPRLRLGPSKASPLEVLRSSADRKDVRRAASAFSRAPNGDPLRAEADAALRALGAVGDSVEIKAVRRFSLLLIVKRASR